MFVGNDVVINASKIFWVKLIPFYKYCLCSAILCFWRSLKALYGHYGRPYYWHMGLITDNPLGGRTWSFGVTWWHNPQSERKPQSPFSFGGKGSLALPEYDSLSTRDLRLYWNRNQSCVQNGNQIWVDCMEVQSTNHSASINQHHDYPRSPWRPLDFVWRHRNKRTLLIERELC